jgi:VRR-NUC domain
MKKTKEGDLVRVILQWLHLRGIWCWRQNAGAITGEYKGKKRFVRFQSEDGLSDIIGMLGDGRFLAVECKVKPNKPTPSQRAFLDNVAARGGFACVAYCLEDVQHGLDRFLQG